MKLERFRKKPVVIEAAQWFKNGDHPEDYADAAEGTKSVEGAVVRYFWHPNIRETSTCSHCGIRMVEHGYIKTLEGGHIVCPGDWIITGVKGEMYPCKPDIFEQTYERLDQ